MMRVADAVPEPAGIAYDFVTNELILKVNKQGKAV